MNYQELQTLFKQRLNRRDVTQTLVDGFISHSIQRTQRLLRTPGSESAAIISLSDGEAELSIPGDYLKMVNVFVDDGEPLVRTDLTTVIRASRYPGTPRFYARNREKLVLGPRPSGASQVTLVYHANFAALTNPTDSNWLTEIAPDVILDGALAKACEHFSDPRLDRFESSFVTAIVDLNTQAQDDELANAQMGTGYSLNFSEDLD
jgi:hypothetical protein